MNKVKFKYLSLFAIVGFAAALLYGLSPALAATSPSLGTASPFAVLAGSTITDIPISAITGNVGLDPGGGAAITGLTCAEVTGTIFDNDGGYTGNPTGTLCRTTNAALLTGAKNDLVTAYDNLAATPNDVCTTDYGVGPQDLTLVSPLVAGVYCVGAGGFQLSGNLTLSGSGVWIFRSATTIITSAGNADVHPSVTGGDPCNVWWRAATSVTLGTSTSFRGNILALAHIGMDTGATLTGRALARNTSVTLDKNTINASACQTTTTTTTSTTTTTLQGGTTTTTLQGGTTTTTLQGGTTTTTLRPPTIPTTGEWGMMILALAFLGAIAWMVRARRSLR